MTDLPLPPFLPTLLAEDERFDEILAEAVAICKKIEPDAVVHI